MKELSIEEKAEAYDKVVERLKDFRFEYRFSAFGDVIEEKFPELKSEDKRIREALVDIIEHFLFWKDKGLTKEKVLAWLEKQGEQKSADKVEPKFKVGDYIKPIDKCLGSPRIIEEVYDGWYVTDKGALYFEFEDNWELVENPVWSEEDEKMIAAIYSCVDLHYDGLAKTSLLIWLKSLKERYTWKPSDEQMERLKGTINSLPHQEVLYSLYQDLKKLRGE